MKSDNLSGNAGVLKRINKVRILNQLRLKGSMTRSELTEKSGLDKKTITNVCNSLLDENLILLKEAAISGRGRPSREVEINPDAAFSIGVDLGARHVTCLLLDFAGQIRESRTKAFTLTGNGKHIIKAMYEGVDSILEKRSGDAQKIAGLGICIPGLIDRKNGRIIQSVNIRGFDNLPLIERMKERYPFPIFLEEASRSLAAAEIWFGGQYGGKNFIVVDLGVGIGLGIVHDGALYRGAGENSGEIGHLVVQPGGRICSCGKTGCLETVASGRVLDEASGPAAGSGTADRLSGAERLCKAASDGDSAAEKMFEDAGTFIGIAVANVINILDPREVILQGGLIKAGDFLLAPLRKAVKLNSLREWKGTLRTSSLGDNAGAMGAAMLPLLDYFEISGLKFN